MQPADVMTQWKFPWSDYLQAHITTPPVVVSKLHPIMGLRLAALFVDLAAAGLATNVVGQGRFQIVSGVRTYAQQRALYEDICLRQGRCEMVANPDTLNGFDAEGIRRIGSNHQAQRQLDWSSTGVPVEVGYAVDIRNEAIRSGMTRAERARAWAPLHRRLPTYGLDWPLKGINGLPLEEWHVEWFPRSLNGPLSGPIAWPAEPGVHRPIMAGMIGGDVEALERQLRREPAGVVTDAVEESIRGLQRDLGRNVTGRWGPLDQRAYRAAADGSFDAELDALEAALNDAQDALNRLRSLRD